MSNRANIFRHSDPQLWVECLSMPAARLLVATLYSLTALYFLTALLMASSAQAADDELFPDQEPIPYLEIPADDSMLKPDQQKDFSSGFVEIRPSGYSGGTADPKTVYKELGERYDDEEMVVIAPEPDSESKLPPVAVVPVDTYSNTEVFITPAQKMKTYQLTAEDKVFKEISHVESPDLLEQEYRPGEPQPVGYYDLRSDHPLSVKAYPEPPRAPVEAEKKQRVKVPSPVIEIIDMDRQ